VTPLFRLSCAGLLALHCNTSTEKGIDPLPSAAQSSRDLAIFVPQTCEGSTGNARLLPYFFFCKIMNVLQRTTRHIIQNKHTFAQPHLFKGKELDRAYGCRHSAYILPFLSGAVGTCESKYIQQRSNDSSALYGMYAGVYKFTCLPQTT
jgi:hypothetical protein